MPTFSVRLFSKFSLIREHIPVSPLDVHKLQELLSYLLLFRSRPHHREALAGLFWGESDTSQSRKNLRQVLWHLQSSLGCAGCESEPALLLVDPDWVQVNPQADIWLDVQAFETASAQALGICGKDMRPEQIAGLRQAVDLYTGDLLEGWYQDWCLFERERLQNMYLVMLDKLIDHCEMSGDCDSGLDYGARILRFDRARERTHFQLMRLYCLDGNRTDALRQYERCRIALQEELNVQPSREVTELYLQIKAGRETGKGPQDHSVQDLIQYLTRLQRELAVASQTIQDEISILQQSLDV
jgi:DNA-binding SARP family transcriptional activator